MKIRFARRYAAWWSGGMQPPPKWDSLMSELQRLLVILLMPRMPEVWTYQETTFDPLRGDLAALTRKLFSEEERSREDAARATVHAVRQKALPATTSPAAMCFLMQRALCAGSFLGECFPPQSIETPVSELPWPQEKCLLWLLDDLWARRRDTHLKLTALALHDDLPFFGLEPSAPNE